MTVRYRAGAEVGFVVENQAELDEFVRKAAEEEGEYQVKVFVSIIIQFMKDFMRLIDVGKAIHWRAR